MEVHGSTRSTIFSVHVVVAVSGAGVGVGGAHVYDV